MRKTLALLGSFVLLAGLSGAAAGAAEFGVASFDGAVSGEDGTPFTQAGGHPYQASTTIAFDSFTAPDGNVFPNRDVKDIQVALPAGFIVNPSATPKCSEAQVEVAGAIEVLTHPTCPPDTQVGVVKLDLAIQFGEITLPVFNVVPPPGRPAQLAFNVLGQEVVHVFPSVRSDSDYGITADIVDSAQTDPFTATTLTLWGVPADASHDPERGRLCIHLENNPQANCFQGGAAAGLAPRALLSNPTSCAGPVTTGLATDSWEDPGVFQTASFLSHDNGSPASPVSVSGCEKLSFAPSFSARPTTTAAGSATGLDVDIHMPQEGLESPTGLAGAELRKAVVSLPAGMSVNPSAANGLAGCTPAQIGLSGTDFSAPDPTRFTSTAAACPDASKIGSVEIDTPLLESPLKGSVYLAEQGSNPFDSLLAVYLVAEGEGVTVKLPGHVEADEATGHLTATFDNDPQLPFEDLRVDFFDGSHAALVTPSECGTYTTTAELTPWSSREPVSVSSGFQIDEGCSHGFSPSFTAGTTNNQGGAFSPFALTFSRADSDQALGAVAVNMPPGLLGVLKSVAECPEPQAAQGACGAGSLIGHTTVAAGVGPSPFSLGGSVYLTGPYRGAPFGLSIVVPAIAGPFNLGTVVVRASIAVDPRTAALTITSDPLPRILQGIPLDLRGVEVRIDRAGFIFNPTDCAPRTVGATITSAAGATAGVSSGFQGANCATLAFKPKFSASVTGRSSHANGAALDVKIASGTGQANIGRVAVSLPKALPSRLSTIQKACPQATFAANPALCPAGSLVGEGTAVTPILARPLTGPAYLVSHGGAAFPDLVVVLRGSGEAAGVTVDLTGAIDITKAGITSSTFSNVPDVPISSFELKLPTGPHSALTGNLPASAKGSFCGRSLAMPTSLTGQNGAQVKQSTKVTVTGCAAKRVKTKRGKR